MNKFKRNLTGAFAAFPLSVLSVAIGSAYAQEETAESKPKVDLGIKSPIEEVLILGRLQDSATDVIGERMEQSVAIDIITSETFSRTGDSTVAAALRRLPGVTLVDDKYVYVRGLGERYLSTTLNGAVVPSPDLTRNVIPLDIFPTSIVESLSVQKVASADMPAAFGGGHVDIRTTGIPLAPTFSIELSTGMHSESDGDFKTYNGGSDDKFGKDDGTRALSQDLRYDLGLYRGNFSPFSLQEVHTGLSTTEAEALNAEIATELFRDINIQNVSGDPDLELELNGGYVFDAWKGIELGVLAGGSYDRKWRNSFTVQRDLSDPDEQVKFISESSYTVGITGNLGFGVRFNEENKINTTSIFIRNTDDDVSINNFFNANTPLSSGNGERYTEYQYEQREVNINQVHGEHELGFETIEALNLQHVDFLEGLTLNWYYSDSEATTDIPLDLRINSFTSADPATGETLVNYVGSQDRNSAQYRFSDLRDFVESYGWEAAFPIQLNKFDIKVIGGAENWDKVRYFEQLRFNLGAKAEDSDLFRGEMGDLYSDENLLNPELGFAISVKDATSSYFAANRVNAGYGKLDVTWDHTLRLVAGVRWEDYQQVNLGWNPNEFEGSPIIGLTQAFNQLDPTADYPNGNPVSQFFDDAVYTESDTYNSVALTWMVQDFWAQDFQLRASYAESTVRPDLREIASSSYFDPITDVVVNGNPDVVPSEIDNFDLRAEWFFSNGDNFTVSAFYKDILNPIELFEAAAADDNIAAKIHNADSAEVSGIEIEFLKGLGDLTRVLDPFYTQGNFTIMDHELITGDNGDSPTNDVRGLNGASEYAANLLVGFDSYDSKHSATLAYNVFGERLYFAGRNGAPDSFEQPFNSLNFTYSFYPTESITIKLRAKNILNEDFVIQRTTTDSEGNKNAVDIIREERGQTFSLSLKYSY